MASPRAPRLLFLLLAAALALGASAGENTGVPCTSFGPVGSCTGSAFSIFQVRTATAPIVTQRCTGVTGTASGSFSIQLSDPADNVYDIGLWIVPSNSTQDPFQVDFGTTCSAVSYTPAQTGSDIDSDACGDIQRIGFGSLVLRTDLTTIPCDHATPSSVIFRACVAYKTPSTDITCSLDEPSTFSAADSQYCQCTTLTVPGNWGPGPSSSTSSLTRITSETPVTTSSTSTTSETPASTSEAPSSTSSPTTTVSTPPPICGSDSAFGYLPSTGFTSWQGSRWGLFIGAVAQGTNLGTGILVAGGSAFSNGPSNPACAPGSGASIPRRGSCGTNVGTFAVQWTGSGVSVAFSTSGTAVVKDAHLNVWCGSSLPDARSQSVYAFGKWPGSKDYCPSGATVGTVGPVALPACSSGTYYLGLHVSVGYVTGGCALDGCSLGRRLIA